MHRTRQPYCDRGAGVQPKQRWLVSGGERRANIGVVPGQEWRSIMSERELIDTGTDKRYVRRNEDGTFKESDDQSRSLSADVRQHAKTKKPRNQGDKGD
jgi:hypothetical protein